MNKNKTKIRKQKLKQPPKNIKEDPEKKNKQNQNINNNYQKIKKLVMIFKQKIQKKILNKKLKYNPITC